MSERNETIADIVAEVRIFKCHNLSTGKLEVCSAIANFFADRIEAAHKREVDALKEQIDELRQTRDLWRKRADELYPNAGIAEEGRSRQVRPKCPFVKN